MNDGPAGPGLRGRVVVRSVAAHPVAVRPAAVRRVWRETRSDAR